MNSRNIKNKNIKLLEIGIFNGASLKMWRGYFSKGTIFGIDNCKLNPEISDEIMCTQNTLNSLNELNRLYAFSYDQNNRDDLRKLSKKTGRLDIIIDDGLHHQSHQQVSLGILFPLLKANGIYIIEDIITLWFLQTGSWWGQKDGIKDTNRGLNLWERKYLKNGKLKNKNCFKDCTIYVLNQFIKTNRFTSPYLNKIENNYLTENISHIKIIYPKIQKRNDNLHKRLKLPYGPTFPKSPLDSGCLGIIRKKG